MNITEQSVQYTAMNITEQSVQYTAMNITEQSVQYTAMNITEQSVQYTAMNITEQSVQYTAMNITEQSVQYTAMNITKRRRINWQAKKTISVETRTKKMRWEFDYEWYILTHYSGRVTQICVCNTVNLGTSASSP